MTAVQWILVLIPAAAALGTAAHALLHKRDPRAAVAWIAVCLMFPVVGPVLYVLLGINRIHTRAHAYGLRAPSRRHDPDLPRALHRVDREFHELIRISDAVCPAPLVGPNRIESLHNGEQAYPSMLAAIDAARETVHLLTYIFERDGSGLAFIEALDRAQRRGVTVRVLLDGFGQIYGRRGAARALRARHVQVAKFLPWKFLQPSLHFNLRNHRKILAVDGAVAFTGGMNIGDRHLAAATSNPRRLLDMHFRCEGPIAAEIDTIFLEDWRFATGEETPPPRLSAPLPEGPVCRAIADGPGDALDRLAVILAAAISSARRRIRIMTPYFLPSRELIAVLNAAALKGVEVQVVLPAQNNIPLAHWATRKLLWELLQQGVRVFYQPPPFVHTKLFVVDDHYTQIGSANIDPRSLRLNFELAVEIYDSTFAASMVRHFEQVLRISHEVTLAEMDARSIPVRLRDGLAWLLFPML